VQSPGPEGAGGDVAGGARSATDRTPAPFHGTVTAVEVVGGVTRRLPVARVDDVVLVAGVELVLTADDRGAGAAHPAAVTKSNAPTRAPEISRIMSRFPERTNEALSRSDGGNR
jgi:hypothetical protein